MWTWKISSCLLVRALSLISIHFINTSNCFLKFLSRFVFAWSLISWPEPSHFGACDKKQRQWKTNKQTQAPEGSRNWNHNMNLFQNGVYLKHNFKNNKINSASQNSKVRQIFFTIYKCLQVKPHLAFLSQKTSLLQLMLMGASLRRSRDYWKRGTGVLIKGILSYQPILDPQSLFRP